MSQPIALGTVLGGRYKVVASLTSSPEGDHVLQGEDQILRRRVSILVPSTGHESFVVDRARSLAGGAGHSGFQVLDMGQTEDSTYLVTSYYPADDLLDALLTHHDDSEDDSLSDDIFGGSRTAASSSYIYEEPDPTQPQQVVAAPDTTEEQAMSSPTTRGVLYVHSAPQALCPHIQWALESVSRGRPAPGDAQAIVMYLRPESVRIRCRGAVRARERQ